MGKRRAPVAQADYTRALKGVLAAGVPLERIRAVRTTPEGVVVDFGDPRPAGAGPVNEWDEALRAAGVMP